MRRREKNEQRAGWKIAACGLSKQKWLPVTLLSARSRTADVYDEAIWPGRHVAPGACVVDLQAGHSVGGQHRQHAPVRVCACAGTSVLLKIPGAKSRPPTSRGSVDFRTCAASTKDNAKHKPINRSGDAYKEAGIP